ncbi:Ig-like domain-containing protein [Kurthia sibirica]|uniref:Bacterial Ig domain-containing protein n=1 Tax=Kurthia sibirica TaxID=202750 RepID=A0A2U3AN51_9BACL|nr:Ig-like domain-containing protein [Kurthia sibirica]PWI25919.1 hypothetical protein DEX24_05140 [Kurthia sibirica]GEK34274.1 hypothetical protein KSI01_18070 [Kurthia sibirica]
MFTKKWLAPATIAATMTLSAIPALSLQAEAKNPTVQKVDYKTPLQATETYNYFITQQPNLYNVDTVIAFARSNYPVAKNYYDNYYKLVEKEAMETKGAFASLTAGAFAKQIIAVSAMGKDPRNVAGYNLIDTLGDKMLVEKNKNSTGVSNYIYAIIALESKSYNYSDSDKYAAVSHKSLVDHLASTQFDNGGFSWDSKSANGVSEDMTAMALIALANYTADAQIKASVRDGFDYIQTKLTKDAGYAPWGGNSADSQAQVIFALTENGWNPKTASDFIKPQGNWAISNILLNFDKNTGGFFVKPGDHEPNNYTTYSGFAGLVAYDRYATERATFFDTSDATTTNLKFDTVAPKTVKMAAVTNTAKTVTGIAEPYAQATIYIASKKVATLTANATGKFTYTLPTSLNAKESVKVYITDLAGNKSKAFSYTVIDKLTPATPKASTVKAGATSVKGTATKGLKVYAKIASKTYSATASKTTGKFTIKVPKQKASTKITLYTKLGNYTSKKVVVTVKK